MPRHFHACMKKIKQSKNKGSGLREHTDISTSTAWKWLHSIEKQMVKGENKDWINLRHTSGVYKREAEEDYVTDS